MTDLRAALRKILFSSSGGISDMADEEIDQILALITNKLPKSLPISEDKLINALNTGYNQAIKEIRNALK